MPSFIERDADAIIIMEMNLRFFFHVIAAPAAVADVNTSVIRPLCSLCARLG